MNAANAVRGWAAVVIAAVVVAGIAVGGQFLPTAEPDQAAGAQPVLGRTTSVCTTGTLSGSGSTDSQESEVVGAAAKTDPDQSGSLTGRLLGDADSGSAPLEIDTQGQGAVVSGPKRSMELTADKIMASSAAGMVYGSAQSGEDRGLSLAPCTPPVVDQWFTGLGATDALRSQLVLSNPDDRQAEVDLTFLSEDDGVLSVPGGSGLIIPAGQSRTISLADLLGKTDGAITVGVHASVGRVQAMARDLRTGSDGAPTGVDWHPASVSPARQQIVPGVPGGRGKRMLTVSNPGDRRAEVKIEILGPDGPFAPVDAGEVSVEAHSATSVDVADGLAKQIGTVRVSSDQPVLTAIRSETVGSKKADDIAVSVSQPPVTNLGLAPAAVVDGSETELAISNGGATEATADVSLVNLDGVQLYHEKIPVTPGATAERRVTQAGPAYLVVRAPEGSKLYGGVTLHQQEGDVYGLAAAALITPALAGNVRTVSNDPGVGQ